MKSSTDRRAPTPLRHQRGIATVLVAIVLLLLVSTGLLTALSLSGSSIVGAAVQNDAIEALFLAESAVERAARRYANGTACDASLAETVGNPFGGGATTSFAVLATPVPAVVFGDCRLRARGVLGNAVRTVEVDLRPGGVPLFSEHFNGIAGWTQVLSSAQGTSDYHSAANCPIGVCSNTVSGTGALRAQTTPAGNNQRLTGYRWFTLPTPITTGSGLTVNTFLGYVKHSANGNPRDAELRVLLEEAGGATIAVWSDPSPGVAPACGSTAPPLASCWQGGTQTVALPASRTYTRIRLYFDLNERGANQVMAWMDAVEISGAGGSVSVVRWTEP
ncbi:MAG TPA: hypothetical protein VGA00_13970 [Acidiferrobacterales bacterium]